MLPWNSFMINFNFQDEMAYNCVAHAGSYTKLGVESMWQQSTEICSRSRKSLSPGSFVQASHPIPLDINIEKPPRLYFMATDAVGTIPAHVKINWEFESSTGVHNADSLFFCMWARHMWLLELSDSGEVG
jgi:hypothetical protein